MNCAQDHPPVQSTSSLSDIRMKRFVFATLLLLGKASLIPAQDTPQALPDFAHQLPARKSGEPVLKFNGTDLSGFYTYLKDSKYDDPKRVFTVRDGLLIVSGEEWGGFATKEEFENYHLIAEWRWGDRVWPPRENAARDSGILLHAVGADGLAHGQWLESIEFQIIEGGCGDIILVAGAGNPSLTVPTRIGKPDDQLYFDPTGTPTTRDSGRFNWWGRDPAWMDVLGVRGARDVEKPVGEWNRMEAWCDGDRITLIVNGVLVNAGDKASPRRGKLLFQSEGAEIQFRKIEIRPIIAN